SLIVEPKTVFYNLMRKGKLILPSEDVEGDMYKMLMDEMAKSGFNQYEISNFSKPGYESKHNLVYWNNEEYFGFGAGAHGYINDNRYSNASNLKKYMQPISEGKRPIFDQIKITKKEKMEEEMFLGLRKIKGVQLSHFQQKFNEKMMDVFKEPIHEMMDRGLLTMNDDFLYLTNRGKLLGNEVFQAFLL